MTSEVTDVLNETRKSLGMHGRPNAATNWYATRHGREYARAAWCDMFVSWVAFKAGLGKKIGEHAYCPSHINWFKAKGLWGVKPHVGAVAFFDWDNDNIADHVGFVEGYSGGTVTTLEGNTGDAVKRRVRYPRDILGYGYPPYAVKAPAGVSEPYRGTLVRLGSNGFTVRKVQQALIKAGHKLPQYGADGYFGLETLAAVKAFQRKQKLKVDGIVGPRTWERLFK